MAFVMAFSVVVTNALGFFSTELSGYVTLYAVIASLVVFGVARGAASGSLLEAVLACSRVSEKGRPVGCFGFKMRVMSSANSCTRAVPVARASGSTNARLSGDNGQLSSAIVEK